MNGFTKIVLGFTLQSLIRVIIILDFCFNLNLHMGNTNAWLSRLSENEGAAGSIYDLVNSRQVKVSSP